MFYFLLGGYYNIFRANNTLMLYLGIFGLLLYFPTLVYLVAKMINNYKVKKDNL